MGDRVIRLTTRHRGDTIVVHFILHADPSRLPSITLDADDVMEGSISYFGWNIESLTVIGEDVAENKVKATIVNRLENLEE